MYPRPSGNIGCALQRLRLFSSTLIASPLALLRMALSKRERG
jgi:hypothetical protein